MSLAECYDSFARILDYPAEKEGLLEECIKAGRILESRNIESPLERFARFVDAQPLAGLQEEYVATFDFNPAVALYLGHHLFGDNRKKVEYMVRLKQEFRRHGFIPSGNDLPDHLPQVLGFLACLARKDEDGARRSFISECVLPGMERLGANLSARKDSPWKPVVESARLLCSADSSNREEGTPC